MIDAVKMTALEMENQQLRELLWLNHGCGITALYGDDGELQCCQCVVDFKRWSVSEILKVWRTQVRRTAALAAQAPSVSPAVQLLVAAADSARDHLSWRQREFPTESGCVSRDSRLAKLVEALHRVRVEVQP